MDVDLRPDLAGLFDVRSTPTLALLKKNDPEPEILSVGVLALDQLKERLWRRIRIKEGLVRPEQYYMQESERGGPFDPMSAMK